MIDEADSILIDEARIPLILAGGEVDEEVLARQVDPIVRRFQRGVHFTLDEYGRNIALTDEGIRVVEHALGCGNLFAEANLALYTAVHNAIHAHAPAAPRRGLRGEERRHRIGGPVQGPDRAGPAMARRDCTPPSKPRSACRSASRDACSASITLQNLVALYPKICGMTGTAATQAAEFRTCYRPGCGGDPHQPAGDPRR